MNHCQQLMVSSMGSKCAPLYAERSRIWYAVPALSKPQDQLTQPQTSLIPASTNLANKGLDPWAFERAPTHKSLLVVTRPPGNSNTVKLGIHYASGFWCPLARPRAVCRATHHAMCLWGLVLACDFGVLPLLCFVSPQTLASLQKQW